MNKLLLLFLLLPFFPLDDIEIKINNIACLNVKENRTLVNYEIKNNTNKDYLFNVYMLNFSNNIKYKNGKDVEPYALFEPMIKVDTNNHLIDNQYVLVKAGEVTKVDVKSNFARNYKLTKGETYILVSGYYANSPKKFNKVPVYRGSINIPPIKFNYCEE